MKRQAEDIASVGGSLESFGLCLWVGAKAVSLAARGVNRLTRWLV